MSIATEITRLQNAKASIKSSIEAKGVTVPSATTLDGYSALIDNIPGGGGITINGDLVDKTIQSGNISKGDFVSWGTSEVNGQVQNDLRYYINTNNYEIQNINYFLDSDLTNIAKVQTKSGASPTNVNINFALPTREQLGIPSGKKVINFIIEGKFSYGGLAFTSGINKSVYLRNYKTSDLSSNYLNFETLTYTNDDASTFPKTFTLEKPSYINMTTDDIGNWGYSIWYGTKSYSINLYYFKYTIIYEDNSKIKTVSSNNEISGIANENGTQGDTIEVYVPSTE